ncbi:unnamed protein product [Amoebophrya sp. A25]|nr:unnamed protein product [Amoebophrya sp. A25]|eukprot:GSA25T00010128001.1
MFYSCSRTETGRGGRGEILFLSNTTSSSSTIKYATRSRTQMKVQRRQAARPLAQRATTTTGGGPIHLVKDMKEYPYPMKLE